MGVFETSTPPGDPPERGEEVEEGAGVRFPHKPDQPVERPQGEAHPGNLEAVWPFRGKAGHEPSNNQQGSQSNMWSSRNSQVTSPTSPNSWHSASSNPWEPSTKWDPTGRRSGATNPATPSDNTLDYWNHQ